jgi:predicted MFS family arabinose efflux permease
MAETNQGRGIGGRDDLGGVGTALSGAAATCTGIGLARFAYVPLFPAMVAAGWVDGAEAGLLGALNLTGYLIGVGGARAMARRVTVPRALDIGMAMAVLAFAACAWHGGLAWLGFWRCLAGVSGGMLMGLAGPSVQAVTPPERRGRAGGMVLFGVGGGIILGAISVPLLLQGGVAMAWLGLAALVALLWLVMRPYWPRPPAAETAPEGRAPPALGITIAYGLSGAGLVPPMLYLSDLAARGRGLGVALGAGMWVLFGLGCIAGAVLGGRAVDRWGGRLAILVWMVIQSIALSLALPQALWVLLPLGLVSGFAALGITTVALAAARERAGALAGVIWVRVTAGFAVAQAISGFALAALFRVTDESHAAVFAAGLLLSLAGLVVAWADWRWRWK